MHSTPAPEQQFPARQDGRPARRSRARVDPGRSRARV